MEPWRAFGLIVLAAKFACKKISCVWIIQLVTPVEVRPL